MPDLSKITLRKITADQARIFAAWQYPPPYEIYNMDPEKIEEEMNYLLDPKIACHGMYDGENSLIGACTFGKDGQVPGGDYSEDALDIGMGIKPELTGHGNGHLFVEAAIKHGIQLFSPSLLRVTIAAFNLRAQKVWQRAGFTEVQQFISKKGVGFLIFTRPG